MAKKKVDLKLVNSVPLVHDRLYRGGWNPNQNKEKFIR